MKKFSLFLVFAMAISCSSVFAAKAKKKADKEPAYQFEVVKELPCTPVKDQYRSGTCWSFATTSFIESEILRLGKGEVDLADMFAVYHSYLLKGEKYVRLHGNAYFPTGGASNDGMDVFARVGAVPESVYTGLHYGSDKHEHGELDRVLTGFLKAVVNGKNVTQYAWKTAYKGILDAYLGASPEKFEYEGKVYTPKSFAESLAINPDDYVKMTSYTHYPFYQAHEMDVPDNWNKGLVYNLPLDELMQVAENSIMQGYTFVWGGDVSDKGFSWKNGIAIDPDEESTDITGTDRDKWESLSSQEKNKAVYGFETIVPEKKVTQEMRQKMYDTWESGDDHGMHAVGIAKDQKGNKYYIIKNSWNTSNPYKGFLYMSEPYFRGHCLDIMVHKDAIPAEIKAKLGL